VKKERRNDIYKKFTHVMLSALTGQASVSVTILVYSTIAVLLLSYVSAQIYAGVLTKEIAELKQARSESKEEANKLTGEYVALSSRSRVSKFCEKRLGMVEAAAGESFEILAVGDAHTGFAAPMELTRKQAAIPTAFGYTLNPGGERPAQ
jgi:cell division protein FtsL